MFDRLREALSRLGGHRRLVATLALVVAAAGVAAIVVASLTQVRAPTPSPSAYGTVDPYTQNTPTAHTPAPTTNTASPAAVTRRSASPSATPNTPTPPDPTTRTTAPPPTQQPQPLHLPASKPTHIDIPAINVHSPVIPIGKAGDGGLAVPQPGPHLNDVAWYKNSPTPGQLGPSVLEGHIDTLQGPSVFLYLADLTPGDTISIARADDNVAVFTVNAVRSYPTHHAFPTRLVYGAGGDLDHATLRLITCANFDDSTGHYEGNTIVYAHLTGTHPAN